MRSERRRVDAEDVALRTLNCLVSDPERLGGFLAATGLEPGTIRAASRSPGFLTGVLDHVLGDEELLLHLARAAGLDPADFRIARERLSPEVPES